MKKKRTFLLIFSMILSCTGCASKADNTLQSVEEIQTTEKITMIQQKETESVNMDEGTLNGVSLDMVSSYISDEHFCDEEELDFVPIGAAGISDDKFMHIRVHQGKVIDNFEDCGEYFLELKSEIDSVLNGCEEIGYSREELTFMIVPIEITNNSEQKYTFSTGNLTLRARIPDDRLVEYGFGDSYVGQTTPDNRLWYDYKEYKFRTKDYYKIDMEPGQSISTNMLYIIQKNVLEEDLYMALYTQHSDGFSQKYQCYLPPTDENIKYIRVHLQEETQ